MSGNHSPEVMKTENKLFKSKQKKQKKTIKNFLPGDKQCGCLQDETCPEHKVEMVAVMNAEEKMVEVLRSHDLIQCPHCPQKINVTYEAVTLHMAKEHLDILVDVLLGIPIHAPNFPMSVPK